ncbi:hypothetical protein DPMN_179570 [Dreissena polymorpha]|uniref:Uncharacterized protein n=1 Tax=Dreissena polymorpha TaxID=45954 RepID=A0A9D4IMG4_DREPO|nr:hypothetical protein DPMN_179570 [Dreissena polymorpha]
MERSGQGRVRERSWSPPRHRERTVTPPHNGSRQLPVIRDRDIRSLPDLAAKTARESLDKGYSPTKPVTRTVTQHDTATSAMAGTNTSLSLTDTSSTLTSTVTTPVPTHREQKDNKGMNTLTPLLGKGHSPPVRDSGSSLTTVTTLTDQQALSSAPESAGENSARDRRDLSFDLGFLDILTVDSNSTVVDQLSTGRVSCTMALGGVPNLVVEEITVLSHCESLNGFCVCFRTNLIETFSYLYVPQNC